VQTKIVCAFVICSVGLLVAATPKSRYPRPIKPGTVVMKQANPPILRAQAEPAPPFFNISVAWSLELDQAQQTLYGQMATILSGVTDVPPSRTNYYSDVGPIDSWKGMVNSVITTNGINTVNVAVFPILTGNDSTSVVSDYSEQYSIDQNNVVTYLGFTDPNGWAGQTPAYLTD